MQLRPTYASFNGGWWYGFYASIVRRRLFRRFFRRAARLAWCNPFDAARSIYDVVSRYAAVAPSLSFEEISLSSFLIWVRSAERWLILRVRRLSFCRARFLACGEFAKIGFRSTQKCFLPINGLKSFPWLIFCRMVR